MASWYQPGLQQGELPDGHARPMSARARTLRFFTPCHVRSTCVCFIATELPRITGQGSAVKTRQLYRRCESLHTQCTLSSKALSPTDSRSHIQLLIYHSVV
ncbi:unnamed protein product [Natator depressus]